MIHLLVFVLDLGQYIMEAVHSLLSLFPERAVQLEPCTDGKSDHAAIAPSCVNPADLTARAISLSAQCSSDLLLPLMRRYYQLRQEEMLRVQQAADSRADIDMAAPAVGYIGADGVMHYIDDADDGLGDAPDVNKGMLAGDLEDGEEPLDNPDDLADEFAAADAAEDSDGLDDDDRDIGSESQDLLDEDVGEIDDEGGCISSAV